MTTSTIGSKVESLTKGTEESGLCWHCFRSFEIEATKPDIIFKDSIAVVINSNHIRISLKHKRMKLFSFFYRGCFAKEMVVTSKQSDLHEIA